MSDAVKLCSEDKATVLASLLQTSLTPNTIIPQFSCGVVSHTRVPLIAIAAAYGATECLHLLIKERANFEQEDGSGWKAVHWACALGRLKSLSILLDSGAPPSSTTGRPPVSLLLVAARYGSLECVQRVLTAAGDVNATDALGRTALHMACWFGHNSLIPILLSARANIDAQDNAGETALHYAAWFGHAWCCTTLIENHASLDIQDKSEWTPLHFAAQHNRVEIVRALLNAGANTKLKAGGKTAEAIAVTHNFEDVKDEFAKANKKSANTSGVEVRPLVEEITEEHNHLNELVNLLAKGRDNHVKQLTSLKDNIEAQQAMISALDLFHTEMRLQIVAIGQMLNDVHRRLLERQNRPSAPLPSRSLPTSHLSECKICGKKEAGMRCRGCHSPICDDCIPLVRQKGCPFCAAKSG